MGGVKSIQRGILGTVPSSYLGVLNITFSAVNPDKCLLHPANMISGNFMGRAQLTSATNLQIVNLSSSANIPISWQVVEYE